MVRRKAVLDLFCGQGGTSFGYWLAGFDVVGVDWNPQPRFPRREGLEFIQGDALEQLEIRWPFFDVIAASPPCQRYSKTQRIRGREHPDLIHRVRDLAETSDLPFVIENVEDAAGELKDPVMLCGADLGVALYRHRLFEPGGGLRLEVPAHGRHTRALAKMGRPVGPREMMHVVGNFSGVDEARTRMGMPWASRDGLREAVPPLYTLYLGAQIQAQLR